MVYGPLKRGWSLAAKLHLGVKFHITVTKGEGGGVVGIVVGLLESLSMVQVLMGGVWVKW